MIDDEQLEKHARRVVFEFLRYPEDHYFGEIINHEVPPDVTDAEYDRVAGEIRERVESELRKIAQSYSGDPFDTCWSCDEPSVDSGEDRYCSRCGDYEGTCVNDHCLLCGADT